MLFALSFVSLSSSLMRLHPVKSLHPFYGSIMSQDLVRGILMRSLLKICGLSLILAVLSCPASQAADINRIGTYGDWSAYTFMEDGHRVCYMASQPVKSEGKYTRRDEVFALVTHRPSEGTKNVFSYITGYTYKPGSDVTVKVNGQTFTLFTQEDTAWTVDPETDKKLTDSIRKGSRMVVKGTSSRGTLTTDTFSLKGSGMAYKIISQKCAVK